MRERERERSKRERQKERKTEREREREISKRDGERCKSSASVCVSVCVCVEERHRTGEKRERVMDDGDRQVVYSTLKRGVQRGCGRTPLSGDACGKPAPPAWPQWTDRPAKRNPFLAPPGSGAP